jgi:hypothetical protein
MNSEASKNELAEFEFTTLPKYSNSRIIFQYLLFDFEFTSPDPSVPDIKIEALTLARPDLVDKNKEWFDPKELDA